MRVECERCRTAVDLGGLLPFPGGFGFDCDRCRYRNILAPVEGPAPAVPPPGAIVCPKCGHTQADPEACHRCGLSFAKLAAGEARLPEDPLAGHPAEEHVRARWELLRQQLDDQAAHFAFIQLCVEQDLLEFAGQAYRGLTPPGASEDPRVATYRERVLRAAMAQVVQLGPRRSPEETRRLRMLLVLTFGALIALGFAVGYYLLVQYVGQLPR